MISTNEPRPVRLDLLSSAFARKVAQGIAANSAGHVTASPRQGSGDALGDP